jgi:hypothetical protein
MLRRCITPRGRAVGRPRSSRASSSARLLRSADIIEEPGAVIPNAGILR